MTKASMTTPTNTTIAATGLIAIAETVRARRLRTLARSITNESIVCDPYIACVVSSSCRRPCRSVDCKPHEASRNDRVVVARERASVRLETIADSHAVTTWRTSRTAVKMAARAISAGTGISYGPMGPAVTLMLESCCVIANATRAITTSTAASANPPSRDAVARIASRALFSATKGLRSVRSPGLLSGLRSLIAPRDPACGADAVLLASTCIKAGSPEGYRHSDDTVRRRSSVKSIPCRPATWLRSNRDGQWARAHLPSCLLDAM